MTELWAQEAAERFWAGADGQPASFPRDLRRAVGLSLPMLVVDLPRLHLDAINLWLARRGAVEARRLPDRQLCGCLLVRNDVSVIFLDATDPDDERRFSLAHEVAHYILEYVLPRERVRERLGPALLDVFDSRRAASPAEQLEAALYEVALRADVHLLERSAAGRVLDARVTLAERRADWLALELLAPYDALAPELRACTTRPELEGMLQTTFGLPSALARAYALHLCPPTGPDRPLLHRLLSNFAD